MREIGLDELWIPLISGGEENLKIYQKAERFWNEQTHFSTMDEMRAAMKDIHIPALLKAVELAGCRNKLSVEMTLHETFIVYERFFPGHPEWIFHVPTNAVDPELRRVYAEALQEYYNDMREEKNCHCDFDGLVCFCDEPLGK